MENVRFEEIEIEEFLFSGVKIEMKALIIPLEIGDLICCLKFGIALPEIKFDAIDVRTVVLTGHRINDN